MRFLFAFNNIRIQYLTVPAGIDFRQNQIWFLVWIIWSYSLSISELFQRVANALNRLWFTDVWRRVFVSAFFVHFLFNLHYLFIYLWNTMGVGAARDALVLWLGSIPYDPGLSQFHVRFYGVSVHARAIFLEISLGLDSVLLCMSIHWWAHRRLIYFLQNLRLCSIALFNTYSTQ